MAELSAGGRQESSGRTRVTRRRIGDDVIEHPAARHHALLHVGGAGVVEGTVRRAPRRICGHPRAWPPSTAHGRSDAAYPSSPRYRRGPRSACRPKSGSLPVISASLCISIPAWRLAVADGSRRQARMVRAAPVTNWTGTADFPAVLNADCRPIRRLSRCASCAKPWPEIRGMVRMKIKIAALWLSSRCWPGRPGPRCRNRMFRVPANVTRTRRVRKSRPRKRRSAPTSGRWATSRNKKPRIPGESRAATTGHRKLLTRPRPRRHRPSRSRQRRLHSPRHRRNNKTGGRASAGVPPARDAKNWSGREETRDVGNAAVFTDDDPGRRIARTASWCRRCINIRP